MRRIAQRINNFGHLWGFDSFTGLPEETKGIMLEGKHWKPGGFSAADALGIYDEQRLLRHVYDYIDYPNVTCV